MKPGPQGSWLQKKSNALFDTLLPRSAISAEAMCLVRPIPVRSENNLLTNHPYRPFAAKIYNSAFGIAEIIGSHSAIALSVDDKSSVHNGITAAAAEAYVNEHEFLPVGLRIVLGDSLIPGDVKKKFHNTVPYDYYFPSIQDKVFKLCCNKCWIYQATMKSFSNHRKVSTDKKQNKANIDQSSDSEVEDIGEVAAEVGDVVLSDNDNKQAGAELCQAKHSLC